MFMPICLGAGFTYWRIKINSNAGAVFVALYDVEMRGVISGPSLCSGGAAAASSSGNGAAANAFDASDTTLWGSTSSAGISNQWLEYRFATPVDIVEIRLLDNSIAVTHPVNITIQKSLDGVTYIDAKAAFALSWVGGVITTATFTIP